MVRGTTSQVGVISYSPSSRYLKTDYHKDGVRVTGSTYLVGVNPQVPSVSFIYRKYEVGGLLQHSNAV